MKIAKCVLGLSLISTIAVAAPTFEKSIAGEASLWNLNQGKGLIGSTLYITGDAAKEMFNNLAGKESSLSDEYGHPTGDTVKLGKNVVCTSTYSTYYRCMINFEGTTGSI